MPSEEKQKINVWIPGSLWKQVESLGYDSPTKATISAFEALVLQEEEGSNPEALGSSQEEFGKLQEEIGRYQEKLKDLEARPDPVTFAQLQARYEGLQEIIKEKEKSIERLENDLTKAGQREEDLKQMHNNYMLQVQSLINQKAIGSPKEAIRKKQEETGSNQKENRKFQEESKPVQKESRYVQKEERLYDMVQENTEIEEKKGSLETTCLNCGEVFTAERSTRKFCSGKCKAAYYRKKSKEEII